MASIVASLGVLISACSSPASSASPLAPATNVPIGGALPPGEYSISFTASADCSALPASVRSRTYSSSLNFWQAEGWVSAGLVGGEFFPQLRTMYGMVRNGGINFYLSSEEAFLKWLEEIPIHERVGPTEYLSVVGTARASLSGVTTSVTTTFDGTIGYCGKSIEPPHPGWAPACAIPAIECRSAGHQLTLSKR